MDPNTQPQPSTSPEVSHLGTVEAVIGQNEQAPLPNSEPIQAPRQASSTAVSAPIINDLASVAPAGSAVATPGSTSASGVVLSPQIADDVDVIEKEWVDAADKIIETTKNDPFQEEEAEEKLQIDYLKKRYGIDVKKS